MKKLTVLLLLCLGQAVMAQGDMKPGADAMPGKGWMGGGMHGFPGHGMGGHGMRGHDRMLMRNLYPPEMIMRHQAELNLSAAQIAAIKKAMKSYQDNSVDNKWTAQTAGDALRQELGKDRIDEHKAMALLDQLTAAKHAMKKQRLAMLITIHNTLNPDQLQKLKGMTCPYMRRFKSPSEMRMTMPMPGKNT